jgi:hypothetical protein
MQLTVLMKRAFPGFKTRLAIRRAVYFPLDVLDVVGGKSDPLVPRGSWFLGAAISMTTSSWIPLFAFLIYNLGIAFWT